jgi:hypothetical protein
VDTPVGSFTGDNARSKQQQIFDRALRIYAKRNERYKDNWRRFGWRGCLFRIRERTERLWDTYWQGGSAGLEADLDDAYDLLNFVAFFIRAVEEGNRGGSWFDED